MMLQFQVGFGQVEKQQYDVFHNNKPVGSMLVTKTGNTQSYVIKMSFNAQLRVWLKSIIMEGQEEACFENGVLKYSTVLRKINGKVKTENQTVRNDVSYVGIDQESTRSLPITEIRFNLLNILFYEPAYQQKIFSDNLQRYLMVSQKSAHMYQIIQPNGYVNRYIYQNGLCMFIELNSSTINLSLKRK